MMTKSLFPKLLMVFALLFVVHTHANSQKLNDPSTTLPRQNPTLMNFGGSYNEFYPSSDTRCQIAFGWYSNQRYAHWISTRHDGGTDYRNALDFYLWKPGDGTADLGTNHVMSITGRGLAVGDIYTIPSGFVMKVAGNVSIDGDIECEKVSVKDIAADFVFEPDYALPTLWEVEQYIKQNKHLPNIPPASETSQGVDLGVLTQTLLQKVEELTLYTIDQEKKIQELQAQLEAIQN